MNRKITLWGCLIGIIRGFLVMMLSQIGTSTMMGNNLATYLWLPIVLGGVSIFPYILISNKVNSVGKLYLLSLLFYVISCSLVFINQLTLKISLFPQREIWYGDAMLNLISLFLYVIISGALHLIVLSILSVKSRTRDGGVS